MQAMYSSVARELKTTQLTDEHPQDYLNFYSLSNREDFNEESSSTWCTALTYESIYASDRNAEVQLGQEYGPKPKIWRVYERKNKRGVKRNDVALNQA
ncbi:hypothetical protein PHAVU_010G081200 [Phaseolus vulgaris]|uniref:Uncharacterized protein n=1 Tax=Phaseolus vulgaris TaxID=3885 RepID=V7ANG0_PHAVU|nr:hypothetical protein PHAVU_010G081200g [Phaseolus vulgaris]ESW06840.1 hypothetical protein PHAVU_010G081200g [Phaseolus vulgaris]